MLEKLTVSSGQARIRALLRARLDWLMQGMSANYVKCNVTMEEAVKLGDSLSNLCVRMLSLRFSRICSSRTPSQRCSSWGQKGVWITHPSALFKCESLDEGGWANEGKLTSLPYPSVTEIVISSLHWRARSRRFRHCWRLQPCSRFSRFWPLITLTIKG